MLFKMGHFIFITIIQSAAFYVGDHYFSHPILDEMLESSFFLSFSHVPFHLMQNCLLGVIAFRSVWLDFSVITVLFDLL